VGQSAVAHASGNQYNKRKAMKDIQAKFINEGATLIIDGCGGRIGIEVDEGNADLCTELFRVVGNAQAEEMNAAAAARRPEENNQGLP